MNLSMKLKRLFLASIIALTSLMLSTVGIANNVQVVNSGQNGGGATTNGGCWKCVG